MKFSGFNTTTKIGIGTNSPARTLDVQGPVGNDDVIAIRHASGGSSWLKLGFWNGTTERASIRTQDDASHVSIFCSTTERLRIMSDGNVGIGTTAPSAILHIRSSGTARNVFYVAASDNSHLAGIYEESDGRGALNVRNAGGTATINLDSGNHSWFTGGNFGVGTASPAGTFHTVARPGTTGLMTVGATGNNIAHFYTSASATALVIDSTGKVGIGTAAPTRKFVISTGSDTYAEIQTTGAANDAWLRFANTGDNDEATNFRIGRTHDGKLGFGLGNGTARMTMLADGKLGIGTTAPTQMLEVRGAQAAIRIHDTYSNVNQSLLLLGSDLHNTNTKDSWIKFFGGAATNDRTWSMGHNGNAMFRFNYLGTRATAPTGGTTVLNLDGINNRVGIGTTAPASLLQVGGAAASLHAAADDFAIAPAVTDVGMTIRCNTTAGTGSIFFADSAATAQGQIRYNHNFDYMSFYSSGDFFFDTGSVGIGTNAPDAKLRVYGGDVTLSYSAGSNPFTLRAVNDAFWMIGDNAATQEWVMSKTYAHDYAFHFKYTPGTAGAGAGIMTIGQTSKNHANYTHGITAFYTNGLERMRIAANGAIQFNSYGSGTHTGTSAYKLSVDSSGNIIETSIGSGAVDGAGTANYISKWTDGDTIGNSIIYDDGTNDVGIGVVPTAVNTSHKSLQIGGNVNIQSYGTKGASGEVDYCHNVYLNQDGNYKLISADEATMYRQGSGKHTFYSWASGTAGSNVSANAAATKLIILQDGNVGIGTNAPAALLHVSAGYVNTRKSLILTNSSNTPFSGTTYDSVVINQDDVPCIRMRETGNSANVELTFAVGNEYSNSATIGTTGMFKFATNRTVGQTGYLDQNTRMVILADGNVGIGTTVPAATLHVSKSSNAAVRLTRTSTDGQVLWFYRGSTASGNVTVKSTGLGLGGGTSENSIFIKTDGNVGIGTTSPGRKLDVDGRVLADTYGFRSDSTLKWYYFDNYSGSNFIGRGGNAYTALYDSGTQSMVWKNGKVGIGGTPATAQLDILSSASGNYLFMDDGANCLWKISSTTTSGIIQTQATGWSSWKPMDLRANYFQFKPNNSEVMRILSTGVAIGTTELGGVSKLEVQRAARTTVFNAGDGDTWHDLIVRNPTNSSNAASGITFLMNNTYHKNAGTGIAAIAGPTSDYSSSLAFITRPHGAVAVERMRIQYDGNVGIGTTAPGHPLVVVTPTGDKGISLTNSSNVELIHMRQEAGDSGAIGLKDGGNVQVWLTSRPSSNSYFNVSGANFGIGTNSPAAKLDIAFLDNTSIWRGSYASSEDNFYLELDTFIPSGGVVAYSFDLKNNGTAYNNNLVLDRGKVGIGTTAPGAKLEVIQGTNDQWAGLIAHTSTTNGYGLLVKAGDASSNISLEVRDKDDGNLFTIKGDGNASFPNGKVGIGTTSPSQALEVHSTIKIGKTGVTGGRLISGDSMIFQIDSDNSSTTSSYRFRTNGAADDGTELMRIQENGNVGIGTNNPGQLLEVGNDGNSDYALIGPTKIGGGMGHGDYAGFSHRSCGGTSNYCLLQYNNGSTYLNAASGQSVYLRINNSSVLTLTATTATFSGAIAGIAANLTKTTSDAYTPTAYNDQSLLTLQSPNANTEYSGIRFSNAVGNYEKFIGSVQVSGNTADIVFQGYDRAASAYKEYARIKENGNVGIGEASPSSKLTVKGAPGNSTYLSYLYNSATHSQAHGLNVQIASSGAAAYGLRVNTGGNTNSLAVMGDGKVGIGTGVPATTLTVAQNASDSGIRLYGYAPQHASYINLRVDSGGHTNFETSGGSYTKFMIGSGYFLLQTAANEQIYNDFGGTYFWRDVDASNAVRMQLDSSNGNLTVNGTLQVNGTSINLGNDDINNTWQYYGRNTNTQRTTKYFSVSASGTQARSVDVCRLFFNLVHWGTYGDTTVELIDSYYGGSGYLKYKCKAGNGNLLGIELVEASGDTSGMYAEYGAAVDTGAVYSGYANYYVPVKVFCKAYRTVKVIVSTTRGIVAWTNTTGYSKLAFAPSLTYSNVTIGTVTNIAELNPTLSGGNATTPNAVSEMHPTRVNIHTAYVGTTSAGTQILDSSRAMTNIASLAINSTTAGIYNLMVSGDANISSSLNLGGALTGTKATFSGTGSGATSLLYLNTTNDASIGFRVSGQAADNRLWDFRVNGLNLIGRTLNDAQTQGVSWLHVARSGNTIASASLQAGSGSVTVTPAGVAVAGALTGTTATFNSPAGTGVALAVKGGNNLVDNILLNLINQSGTTVLNVRNNGALYGTAATFSGALTGTSATFSGALTAGRTYVRRELDLYNTTGGGILRFFSDDNVSISKLSNESSPYKGYFTSYAGYTPSGAELLFRGIDGICLAASRNGAVIGLRMNEDGEVGIGTTGPSKKLHVSGTTGDNSRIRITDTTNSTNFDVGTDGNGGFFSAIENKHILFYTNGSEKVRIENGGYVGIGTNNPTQKLMVWQGSSSVSFGEFSNGAVIWLDGVNGDLSGGDYFNILADSSTALRFGFGTANKVSMLNNGNVGIGTTVPAATLHVLDTTASTSRWTAAFVADNAAIVSAQTHDHVLIQSNDVPSLKFYEYGQDQVGGIAVGDNNTTLSTTEAMRFYVNGSATGPLHDGLNGTCALKLQTNGTSDFYGNVNIANNKILSVGTAASNSSGKVRLYGGSGTAYYMDYQPVGTQDRNFRFNGSSSGSAYTTYFNQQGSGNHNLYVDGDITSAGTGRYIYAVNLNVTGYKNFEIEHPTKEKMMLVHSSLEGPEAGVYHRGRVQSDTITMPDYWSGLVREDTITVQLTPNGSFQHLYVVSTSLSEIKIGAAEGETIDCYYIIYGERADVAPLVVEDAAAWERFQERKSAMSDGKA